MIQEIGTAIIQHYNASPGLNSSLEGLFFQQAEQKQTAPYAVFYINGITQDEIMGTADDNITNVEIQFNLFSEADDAGMEIAGLTDLLTEAFDWAEINVDGYYWIKLQRENILPIGFVDEVWQTTVHYSLSIAKN